MALRGELKSHLRGSEIVMLRNKTRAVITLFEGVECLIEVSDF